jgi:Flp pilus assembly protein TadD
VNRDLQAGRAGARKELLVPLGLFETELEVVALGASEVDPEHAEAWNNLGVGRGEQGDRRGAIAALSRALELVPHYADAHYNLAEALAVAGDLDGARRHWRAYLTFDPNSRWAEQVRRRLQSHGG